MNDVIEKNDDVIKKNDGFTLSDVILDVELPIKGFLHSNDPKGEIEIHGHGVRILDWERRTFTFIKKEDLKFIVCAYKKLGEWE